MRVVFVLLNGGVSIIAALVAGNELFDPTLTVRARGALVLFAIVLCVINGVSAFLLADETGRRK